MIPLIPDVSSSQSYRIGSRQVAALVSRRGDGKLLFIGYKVSGTQAEKVLEIWYTMGCLQLKVLYCTLKIFLRGQISFDMFCITMKKGRTKGKTDSKGNRKRFWFKTKRNPNKWSNKQTENVLQDLHSQNYENIFQSSDMLLQLIHSHERKAQVSWAAVHMIYNFEFHMWRGVCQCNYNALQPYLHLWK